MNWITQSFEKHNSDKPLLQVENLSLQYGKTIALSQITFGLDKGESVALIGPNGAGKSSLMKIVAGLEKPTSGHVRLYGSDPDEHVCIAYLPQHWQIDWHFPVSVFDVVMMGRAARIGLLRRSRKIDKEMVKQALDQVGISDLRSRQIGALSGGQKQRVLIARALAQEPEILLLDEPFNGLDPDARNDLLKLIDRFSRTGVTMLVSLHDLKIARDHFARVIMLNKTIIQQGEPTRVFRSENLIRAYRSHLHFIPDADGQLTLSDMCCEGDQDRD